MYTLSHRAHLIPYVTPCLSQVPFPFVPNTVQSSFSQWRGLNRLDFCNIRFNVVSAFSTTLILNPCLRTCRWYYRCNRCNQFQQCLRSTLFYFMDWFILPFLIQLFFFHYLLTFVLLPIFGPVHWSFSFLQLHSLISYCSQSIEFVKQPHLHVA